jgi:hypothetical protein
MTVKHRKDIGQAAPLQSAPQTTPEQRMLHALGNSLSAARLRLEVLTRDSTCMWAQKANIEALAKTLAEAAEMTSRLEMMSWQGPGPKTGSGGNSG